MTNRFICAVLVGSFVIAACSSSDEVGDNAKDVATTAVETTTGAAPAEESTTSPVEEPPTTAAETSTTAAALTMTGPAEGVLFADPGGAYALLLAPNWTDGSGVFPDGIQGWFTGVESAAFAENVNIVTSDVPGATPLPLALEASIEQLEQQFEGFTLIESFVLSGTNHPELGALEYTAVQSGMQIRFLQTFGLWDGKLVVFTLSTDAAGGAEAVDMIRPYALTIAPAAG